MKNFLIADSHGMFRDAMCLYLKEHCDHCYVDTVASLNELLATLDSGKHFHLLLLDLALIGMQGVQGIHTIAKHQNKTPIIIISPNRQKHFLHACLRAGADGFVPKASDGKAILAAIRLVLAGGKFIPPQTELENPAPKLSKTKLRVLELVAQGASNRDIANKLYLSEGTVKQYTSDIYRKLGASNRTQAAQFSREILGIY